MMRILVIMLRVKYIPGIYMSCNSLSTRRIWICVVEIKDAKIMSDTSTLPNPSRLKFFPVTFFAIVMGFSGLTLAWHKGAHVLGIHFPIGHVLAGATFAVFLTILAIYTVKFAKYPKAVIGELNHPVTMAFFPAISISMLLLSICMLDLHEPLALGLWALGAALHLVLTLHVVRSWINHDHFDVGHLNPAWFIPAVGNVVVPITGMHFGYVEISWFYFAIGMSFWIVLLTIVFNRMLFHEPMPVMLLPTMFILIAPPAVGFISYLKLNGGHIDTFAHVLYYLALFLTLLLMVEIPRFIRLPFFLSWWAYSFPMTAITVATFVMSAKTGQTFLFVLALALLAAVSGLILLLLFKTLQAIAQKTICVERKH